MDQTSRASLIECVGLGIIVSMLAFGVVMLAAPESVVRAIVAALLRLAGGE